MGNDSTTSPAKRTRWRRALGLVFCMLLAPATGFAAAANTTRWAERTAPVYRLVASQAGEDAGVPYAGTTGALAQDQTGFIWIGTDVGLERWDGYRMRTYQAHGGDPCALPADYVISLHVDGAGRLWISTFGGGVAFYEPQTDCIRTVGPGNKILGDASVGAFADDGANGLWLGTTAGLLHLGSDLQAVTRLPESESAQGHLSHVRIGSLLRDRRGALWVGSGSGLERRKAGETTFGSIARLAGAKVRTLLEGSDGRIWVGTVANGAFVIDPATERVQAIDDIQGRQPLPLIWNSAEAATGEILFGTTNAGIIRVDPASLRARPLRHQKGFATSLPDDEVNALLRDRRGLMWVASGSGVGYFNSRDDVATVLSDDESNGIGEGIVQAMARLADGRIALGAATKIFLIGPEGTGAEYLPLDPLPKAATLATIATLNGHDLFAAAGPFGLVWIDRTARRSQVVPLSVTNNVLHVLSLLADGDRLWVGGLEGIWTVERRSDGPAAKLPWRVLRRLDLPDVMELALGTGETRWAGTVKGLYAFRLSSAEATHVQLLGTAGEPIADPHIRALHMDRRGRLWIGSNSDGIFVVDPGAGEGDHARVLQHLSTGLPSGEVTKIVEDGQGAIWVSTDRGIARINAQSFAVTRLTRGDGIAIANHVNGICADEFCNELLFGGFNGMTLIRTDRQPPPLAPPPVVITRISVGREEVASSRFNTPQGDPVLNVPADAHNLAVEFATLDYSDPGHNHYEYQLEGNDGMWMPTRFDAPMAMYTNLAPGTYRLRLRGTDHSGEWSPLERQLIVQVAAAWYQSMWFHALEILGLVLASVSLVHVRTVVLRARQRELEALVVERTRALEQEKEARSTLIENLAHDLRTPLTSLRAYLERLSLQTVTTSEADRGRYVAIAARQAERLNRLIRELFEMAHLESTGMRLTLERFRPADLVQDVVLEFRSVADGRTIDFQPGPGAESAEIMGDISLMERMIDNLVDNAVQHTPLGGTITLTLSVDGDQMVLEVRDTGRGIEPEKLQRIFNRYERGDTTTRTPGTGLGLAIVKRIVELHCGTISVESRIGMGTRFMVRLPLGGPAP